ncbi:AfsA-related hotdog domain-containing protein [Fluviispira vulneris]|uniref:AfsA-related hotdog domain-containing protein n=1 Tax=Fluviispira vulneris TaxID=2763012 RepID=UPI001644E2A3|nr:AfsA-related hotdog domain-containing protein [Fluviispira vulneris]
MQDINLSRKDNVLNIEYINKEIFYIVGDNFDEFAQGNNVITLSNFISDLKSNNNSVQKSVYYLGQGLNKQEKEIIIKYAKDYEIQVIFPETRATIESKDTHKHKQENILITCPHKIDNNTYQSHLIIDDSCAEMSDHMTGRHIQGMVLIEAARQMMIAISEKYILEHNNRGKFYCIWSNIVTKFNNFLFPIDVVIEHHILDMKVHTSGTYKINSSTKFIQNNIIGSEIEIEYKLYNKKIMKKIEEEIAEKHIKNFSHKIKNEFLQSYNF